MKVVTLNGTFEIDLEHMEVGYTDACRRVGLKMVPSPVVGERMKIVTVQGEFTTEQVREVQP